MNKVKSIITENYKYILSIMITMILSIVMYTNSLHYPLKFLAVLFVISSLVMIFLPKKIEKTALLTILIFGSISAIISPVNDIPDEYVHYARSVFVSEGQFNLNNNVNKLKISKDVKIIIDHTGATYNNKYLLESKHKLSEYPEANIKGTNAYYSISYIPQAIGVLIGNSLGLSLLLTYYLGRLVNLLVYALLAYLAIKVSGKFKQVFAVIAMLPMNIYLAASYNQDAFAIGIILLTIAIFIDLLDSADEPRNNIKLLIYVLLVAILVLTKFTYFLLILLPFFLPNNRFGKWTKLTIFNKMISIAIIVLFAAFWFKLYGQIKTPYIADFLKQVDVGKQVHNLIATPTLYGRIVLREMIVNIVNMDNIFQFGPLSYGITNIFQLYLMFIFFIFLSNASKITVNMKEKFGLFIVISGIIGATVLAMYLTWTPVGGLTVLGVQSRYLIGTLPLLFLLFSTKNKKIQLFEDFISTKLATHISILFIMVMLITTIFRYY